MICNFRYACCNLGLNRLGISSGSMLGIFLIQKDEALHHSYHLVTFQILNKKVMKSPYLFQLLVIEPKMFLEQALREI